MQKMKLTHIKWRIVDLLHLFYLQKKIKELGIAKEYPPEVSTAHVIALNWNHYSEQFK